jgi:hypothetical protein
MTTVISTYTFVAGPLDGREVPLDQREDVVEVPATMPSAVGHDALATLKHHLQQIQQQRQVFVYVAGPRIRVGDQEAVYYVPMSWRDAGASDAGLSARILRRFEKRSGSSS